MDPYQLTRETHGDTPERWQKAGERAIANELTIRPGLVGTRFWTVSSASRPDLAHASDGQVCSCKAGEMGDPVCQHRWLVRMIEGRLPAVATPRNVVFIHRRHDPRPAA